MPAVSVPKADGDPLGRILERLRQAREACLTANLEHLLEALEILRAAAVEFEAWTDHLCRHPGSAAGLPRTELTRVKREVASFLRLVDSCAAVQSGLATRSGANAVVYSPNGSSPVQASAFSAYDMQG